MGDTNLATYFGRLSLACNAAVLTVDYRAPPENDRAESLEDLDKAYKWLITQPGVAPAKLFLMADGLGAPLAVSLMINIR
jgi:acetyl esterase/lipase